MDRLRRIIGDRICTARVRLSFTQQDLAEQAGFAAAQIISQIEKGEREVKAWELVNLAKILRVEFSDLLASEEPEPYPEILWRIAPERHKKKLIEAEFLQRCQQYALLERLCEGVTERDLTARNIVNPASMSFQDAENLGEEIRQEFNLGARPAASLVSTLEDIFAVKIWYKNLGEEGSAASLLASFGAGILMNSAEAPWRRNFSFGHELFHLLTWESFPVQLLKSDTELRDKVEKLANAFASSLLLPTNVVNSAFQRHVKDDKIGYADIIGIAREFDVSTAALLYRLLGLGLLDRDTVESLQTDSAFQALDRSTMRGHWWTPPDIPERFVRLAFIAYQKGRLSRARLAQFLDTSLVDLTDDLLEYGLDDREDYKTDIQTVARC